MPAFSKVLFIDDDAITTTICERIMNIVDFAKEFVGTSDGLQAKEYLLANLESMPEIIFVDLHMTVMNGWEFLDWYTKWSKENSISIPIYVLSSSLSKEDFEQAYVFKVNGYIVKPMTASHLKEIISKFAA